MRVWIYNRIKAIAGLAAIVGDRISSAGSLDNPAVKPFIHVAMGVEQPALGMPAEARVQRIPFTCYVHDTPGSMIKIDQVAQLLKDNLPTPDGVKVGGMSVYQIEWTDTGEDGYDDHFGTNVRPVRFSMMTRRAG